MAISFCLYIWWWWTTYNNWINIIIYYEYNIEFNYAWWRWNITNYTSSNSTSNKSYSVDSLSNLFIDNLFFVISFNTRTNIDPTGSPTNDNSDHSTNEIGDHLSLNRAIEIVFDSIQSLEDAVDNFDQIFFFGFIYNRLNIRFKVESLEVRSNQIKR